MSHLPRLLAFVRPVVCLLAISAWPLALVSHAANPVISEFMAANQLSLLDEDGEPSDWIELHNPTLERVNLADWSLTDDPLLRNKWRFPERFLDPGAFLIVFASGKNRIAPGPLHTNFRLDAEGEYLALFPPGGAGPASEFSPRFPPQEADVSFGIPMLGKTRDLLQASEVWMLLPTSAADVPTDWSAPGSNPGSNWTRLNGFAVGFDSTPAGFGTNRNLAIQGTASQSTIGFGFSPANAIDGDPNTFTHTDSNDNASTWAVDLGAATEISQIILRNRQDCCRSRFRDLTVNLLAADGKTVVWSSGLLNPENKLGSPGSLTLDLFQLNVGPIEAQTIQVVRTPDPDLSGSGGAGNNDEDNVLSLGEVEVYGVASVSYAPLIRSDLSATMKGHASSAFFRVPFNVDTIEDATSLALRLRFDDGVLVHLNGTEIAARNTPTAPDWDSVAPTKRVKSDALTPEVIDLLPFRALVKTGTNWLAFQGLNSSVNDAEFLLSAELLLETRGSQIAAYLERPTPGASNLVSWNLGRVADTKFSVGRGRKSAPLDLALSTATAGAEIRYTLDGAAPTAAGGTVYTGPIRIDHTMTVRAAAFKPDYRPTDVDTHTYVFLADVVRQPALPNGFPANWAGVAADYAMDPRITQAPAYANRMEESLQALPTIAITTDRDNLFGTSRGVYANPERSGADWERPISLEWIRADGTSDFQVDCGLRVQGGHFRQRFVTQKHSLRLLFKGEYGVGRLHQNLFGEFGAAQEFDTLVLRAGANDGYAWNDAINTEQFIRDEFGRRSALAMGQASARGQFVHLYLNGLYWGVYNLTERPAEDFSATYFGGEAADWDAINSGDVKAGSLDAWNAFMAGARKATTLGDYQRLKGLNSDGTRHLAFPEYFDATNYIDYMLVNIWGGNWDWPNKNFWFGRHRGGQAGGFKFYLWDFENTMGNNRDRSPLNMVSPRPDIAGYWVGEPHAQLQRLEEYRMEFADRVQKHFFNGGALAPESLIARYRALASGVEPAIIAETARWGDDNWPSPQDLADWQRERDWIVGTYLPQRTGVVLEQLRTAGLFPALAAPTARPAGGSVTRTTPIQLSAAAPELFYTTNGVDPRLPGGAVHATAIRLAANGTATDANGSLLIGQPTWLKARARQGAEWSPLTEGRYRLDVVPATSNHLVIAEFCYRPADPATPAERAASNDRDDFEFIELLNISTESIDLTGVHFTAGILFNFPDARAPLAPGQRTLVVRNQAAFTARYGTGFSIAGQYQGALSNSGEEIALIDAGGRDIARLTYLDSSPWPPSANANGYSLVYQKSRLNPDPSDPDQWRASVRPGGSPGSTDASAFVGSPEADSNGNGQPDLFDYAFGALLTNPLTGIVVGIEPFESNGQRTEHLLLTYPRNLAADDAAVILETAPSPTGPWHEERGGFSLVREERAVDGTARQSYRMNTPLGAGAVFVRLSVSLAR